MFNFFKKKQPIKRTTYKLNLQKDKEDDRDLRLRSNITSFPQVSIPKAVNLADDFPVVFSQNDQGSCTANAGVAVLEYLFNAKQGKKLTLSRQYLYNQERINDGTPLSEDSGTSIRQICKTLKKNGCCKEMFFPYGWEYFNKEPHAIANDDAATRKIKSYMRCETMAEMRYAISIGCPILLGVSVYKEFYDADKGVIPDINISGINYGGHAVVLCGYRTKGKKTQFLIRNSWGPSVEKLESWGYAFNNPSDAGWGKNGYAWIDDDNLQKILLDAWAITAV